MHHLHQNQFLQYNKSNYYMQPLILKVWPWAKDWQLDFNLFMSSAPQLIVEVRRQSRIAFRVLDCYENCNILHLPLNSVCILYYEYMQFFLSWAIYVPPISPIYETFCTLGYAWNLSDSSCLSKVLGNMKLKPNEKPCKYALGLSFKISHENRSSQKCKKMYQSKTRTVF